MISKVLLTILTICSANAVSPKAIQRKADKKLTVSLVGSIHNMHFNPNNHYSINDLLAQISTLKPDVVCGEITPESFNQPMEGYFPPEATYPAEIAYELKYRFVPANWGLDYTTQNFADKEYPLFAKEKSDLLFNSVLSILKEPSPSLYDKIHSKETLSILDSLYENIIGVNALAEIACGSWHERNRRAVEHGLKAAPNAQTIVFVFGVDHLPQLQQQLNATSINARRALQMVTPNLNQKSSKTVLERWKRNCDSLISIYNKKMELPYDSYLKVVDSQHIKNYEETI